MSGRKVVEKATEALDMAVRRDARRWFRPPFARDELAFLTACTRCQACIEACPEGLIFRLPMKVGVRAAGTPALDLINHACALCPDWPCVQACEPGALALPARAGDRATPAREPDLDAGSAEDGTPALPPRPQLARVRIDPARCLPYQGPECGACAAACAIPGALRWHGPRPQIDAALCVGCGRCRVDCITEPKAIDIRPMLAEEAPA